MPASKSTAGMLHTAGMVYRVDTINRELAVFVNGDLLTFDVPVDCSIVLHGERVRFRMVQPQDRVEVTYVDLGCLRAALVIEAQPA